MMSATQQNESVQGIFNTQPEGAHQTCMSLFNQQGPLQMTSLLNQYPHIKFDPTLKITEKDDKASYKNFYYWGQVNSKGKAHGFGRSVRKNGLHVVEGHWQDGFGDKTRLLKWVGYFKDF